MLQLAPGPSSIVPDDRSVAGAGDVQVVLHGQGQTRRYVTTDLGSGRYGAAIVFPEAGSWAVQVGYRPGARRPLEEIQLGKGGARVDPRAGASAPTRAAGHVLVAVVLALLSAGLVGAVARARARARATRTRPG